MTRPLLMVLALLALVTLASCGADGAPVRPSTSAAAGLGAGSLGVSTEGSFSLGLSL